MLRTNAHFVHDPDLLVQRAQTAQNGRMKRERLWRVFGLLVLTLCSCVAYAAIQAMRPVATATMWRDIDVSALQPGSHIATEVGGVPVWIFRMSSAQRALAPTSASEFRVFIPQFEWHHQTTGWRGLIPVREIDSNRRSTVHPGVRDRADLLFEDAAFHDRYFDQDGRAIYISGLHDQVPIRVSDMLTPDFLQLDPRTLRISPDTLRAQFAAPR